MEQKAEELRLHRWVVVRSAAYHVPMQGPACFREVEEAVRRVACPFLRSEDLQKVADTYYMEKRISGDPGAGIHGPHLWVSLVTRGVIPVAALESGAPAKRHGFRLVSLDGVTRHPVLDTSALASRWRAAVRLVTEIALDLHCGSREALHAHQIELARLQGAWGPLRELLEPYLARESSTYQRVRESGRADEFWDALHLEYPTGEPQPPWRYLFKAVLGIDYDWRDVLERLGLADGT